LFSKVITPEKMLAGLQRDARLLKARNYVHEQVRKIKLASIEAIKGAFAWIRKSYSRDSLRAGFPFFGEYFGWFVGKEGQTGLNGHPGHPTLIARKENAGRKQQAWLGVPGADGIDH
jgi:hypothetical protein